MYLIPLTPHVKYFSPSVAVVLLFACVAVSSCVFYVFYGPSARDKTNDDDNDDDDDGPRSV